MRVRVAGAGGPAGVNACRALIAAGHDVCGTDDNPAHYPLIPVPIDTDGRVDALIPQPDPVVLWAAHHRDVLPPVFLPDLPVIFACQAKGQAATIWHRAGLRGRAIRVTPPYPDWLHLAADEFGLPFWLRADRGAGANKAIRVDELATAHHWIRFWETRGADVRWIAEPFLPGRDIAWTSLWYQGELLTSFARERLEYLYPHLTPEGLTGTPTAARVIHDDVVSSIGLAAVAAVDERPHGIYSVDLREDPDDVPRPTEINAGRGFTTLGLWSLRDVNFYDLAARAAVGQPYAPGPDPLPEGLTLHRHIDCGHVFAEAAVEAAA